MKTPSAGGGSIPQRTPGDRVLDESGASPRDDPGREVRRRILDAGDSARRRLARDLHDGAQQKFVTAMINLQLAQGKFDTDPQRARRYLDDAVLQAEAGLAELRDFVTGIHPPILTHLGLRAALDSLVDALPIPVAMDVTETRFAHILEDSVYYFVSEALTNVVKHAHASRATVRVAAGDTLLCAEVSDDGLGGATLTSGGTGLMGLLDRVEALDGELTISSPPTSGTTLRALIPLSEFPLTGRLGAV
jgi:signal transduction histidine kinase